MTRVYYKDAVGCFIVFDVTRASTFEAVIRWKNDLDSKVTLPDGNPVPCVLLANKVLIFFIIWCVITFLNNFNPKISISKCDLNKEGLANNQAHMDEFCKEKGFIGWYETSAKENINVEQASKFLVSKIIEKENTIKKLEEQQENDKLQLTNTLVPPPKSKCC